MAVTEFTDSARAGWGVIIAADSNRTMIEGLRPLIDFRSRLMARDPVILTVMPGESVSEFLSRNGVAPGLKDPARVPYYLLIVADPQSVSFDFQSDLDLEYATGRLHFESADEYAEYANLVVAYETATTRSKRQELVTWVPETQSDRELTLCANFFIQPLADQFNQPGFDKQLFRGSQATKERLLDVLRNSTSPTVLITACHGVGFRDFANVRERAEILGALYCEGWQPGATVSAENLVTAEDIPSQLNSQCMIHWAFASYSAGTSGVSIRDSREKNRRAPPRYAILASLPRRLLLSGALGFIGNYDRVWSYAFLNKSTTTRSANSLTGYRQALNSIAGGVPFGHALRELHDQGLAETFFVANRVKEMTYGRSFAPATLIESWTAAKNARTTILVGDPAAAIRL